MSGVCFRLWMRLGASRAVPVPVFLDLWSEELVAVSQRRPPTGPHGRTKVIFHLAAIKHIIAGLMANSKESQMISQRLLQFQERSKGFGTPASTARRLSGTGLWSHFLSQEWSSALLYLFLDVVSWLAIYRVAGWFRYDAFYATPFQFFVINLIQLGVIVMALYFVGGYDRSVEKLTLGYTAEHILAVIAAGVVSAMVIYSAATFDQTMKPSRGVAENRRNRCVT